MRIYGVLAPLAGNGKMPDSHYDAYLRCLRCVGPFSQRCPKAFSCVFTALRHDSGAHFWARRREKGRLSKRACQKSMRIYGILSDFAPKMSLFSRVARHGFVRICRVCARAPFLTLKNRVLIANMRALLWFGGRPWPGPWGWFGRRLYAYLRCFRRFPQQLHNARRRFHAYLRCLGMIWSFFKHSKWAFNLTYIGFVNRLCCVCVAFAPIFGPPFWSV